MDVAIARDFGAVERRVDGGMSQQGHGDGFGNEIAEAQADFFRFEGFIQAYAHGG